MNSKWVFLFCRCGSKTPPAYTRNPVHQQYTPYTQYTQYSQGGKMMKHEKYLKKYFSVFWIFTPRNLVV